MVRKSLALFWGCIILSSSLAASAAVTLESSTKIADNALHFDGSDIDRVSLTAQELQEASKYYFKFGGSISAHGDSVKSYKHYVFMTWYRGGKDDRHVMLSRLNTETGSVKTIEFPHRHTGYQGRWWIGESHNTIGLSVSPKNGTIHMVYDMHAYGDCSTGSKFCGEKYPNEPFKNDFFRYSYSVSGAAEVADDDFTLEKQFVKDTSAVSEGPDDYKHLVMTKNLDDKLNFADYTYPKFFETAEGDLLHYMRWGGNNNGAYYYNRYDADAEKWSKFVPFSRKNQKSHGLDHNWGLYGNMKYFDGKLGVAFQKRSSNNNDKFVYQNGIYYAYLDDPETNLWRDHTGKQITWPLVDADEIKVFEPGDLVEATSTGGGGNGRPPGSVYIVGGFDWALTDKGDLHFTHSVRDLENNKTVHGHLYKPAGATEFVHEVREESGSRLYASGDNIYLIGLETIDGKKRPTVSVAKGGTNDFQKVYSDTTTPLSFAHGVASIKDGKVYYYLMQQSSGTERPIHLQVIDLGISKVSVSFEQSVLNLVKDYTALSISAIPSILDQQRSVKSVALYLNDEVISTLNSAPYTWTHNDAKLQDLGLGSYTIKAVVTSDIDEVSETTMTLNIVDPTPTVEFVESNIMLLPDYNSVDITVTANTPDENRTIAQVSLYLDDKLVSADDTAPYQWTYADADLKGLTLGEYTLKAVVVDSKGDSAETTSKLSVFDPTPSVEFTHESYSVVDGYTSFTLRVDASTAVDGRSISQVELFVNDTFIRKESVAPYDWGHNGAFLDELLNFPVGKHTLKAIVTDSEGLSTEVLADFIVEESAVAPEVSFEQSSLTMEEGYSTLVVNVTASTPMTSRTMKQVTLYINNTEVSTLTSGSYQWTQQETALSALPAGTHVLKAVAVDSQDMSAQTTMELVVTAKATTPVPTPEPTEPTPAPAPTPEPNSPSNGNSGGGGGSTGPLMLIMFVLLTLARRFR